MDNKKIYHITHVDNLAGILKMGRLWCDKQRIKQKFENTNIGHNHIKTRRLNRPVTKSKGGTLGNYVPFNFCSRSVMLYVVSQGHQDYNAGQEPILHLVSSINLIKASKRPWMFTDIHAELGYSIQFDSLEDLDKVAWDVMPMTYWRDSEVKQKRQAEFLVHNWCPWTAIDEIAVINQSIKSQVEAAISNSEYKPPVQIRRSWYY